MEMERHSCKLCSRTFVNGRALGGHMKAHLSSPRPTPHIPPTLSSNDDEDKSPATIYGLRENPRKSIKFSFSASGASPLVVTLDGDSEAESKVRKRRSGRIVRGDDDSESPEAEPVSSVSDTSPEEDVAMCLVMLSRDDGLRSPAKKVREIGVADTASQKQQHQCEICKKSFRSSQALGGHRIIHRKKVLVAEERIVVNNKPKSFGSNRNLNHDDNNSYVNESRRIFECSFCGKVFGSGQALGGHKRSHLMGGFGRSSSSSVVVGGWEKITLVKNVNNNSSSNNNVSFIDLNMPAPLEDEDVYSVVSDDDDGGGPANY